MGKEGAGNFCFPGPNLIYGLYRPSERKGRTVWSKSSTGVMWFTPGCRRGSVRSPLSGLCACLLWVFRITTVLRDLKALMPAGFPTCVCAAYGLGCLWSLINRGGCYQQGKMHLDPSIQLFLSAFISTRLDSHYTL